MQYLDSSALIKRYVREDGTDAVISRFEGRAAIYTSALTFAEVHAAFGRKFRDKHLSASEKQKLVEAFSFDWAYSLIVLGLTDQTLLALPLLCEKYSLKGSDAVHLSAAIWLKESIRLHAKGFENSGEVVEFGVSDRQLAEAALRCGFAVFNPA